MTIGVVIADDQALVRGGFRVLVDTAADMEVLGEASDGTEAVALAREHHPGVVLMDVRMPGRGRQERVRAARPDLIQAAASYLLNSQGRRVVSTASLFVPKAR
jgi:DNA-binding NarL/FixJ family response regulator